MKKYIFRDTDDYGRAEYDIAGKDYEILINTCCKYCNILAFKVRDSQLNYLSELEKFKISPSDKILSFYSNLYRGFEEYKPTINYYRVCPELNELLLKMANSIWDFEKHHNLPADPVFYREDGSVFFYTVTHDGWCCLFARDDEEIESVIADSEWDFVVENKYYGEHYFDAESLISN